MILVSHNNPPVVGDPADGALGYISSLVAIPESVFLSINAPVVFSMMDQKVDTSFSQTFSGRIAVICLVSDHSLWPGPWSSESPNEDAVVVQKRRPQAQPSESHLLYP